MMGDLRDAVYGPRRTQIDDEHTVALYAIYRERAKAINSLLAICVVIAVAMTVLAVLVGVALVVHWWRVLL